MFDVVLRGGTLVDGSGEPARQADVALRADRIVAIGSLADVEAGEHIDIGGLVVAPGFVDLHTHSDLSLLSDGRARSKIHQGVTTEVLGNCGLGVAPAPADRAAAVRRASALVDLDPAVAMGWTDVAGYLAALRTAGTAVNVALLAGHLPLRIAVNGDDAGPLGKGPLEALAGQAEATLRDGAVGLSTGLMYPPARFADTRELVVLGRVASARGAIFAMHLRDYGDGLERAVREALDIARRTGCRLQLSHLAVVGQRNRGSVARSLLLVDDALAEGLDVGVDIYPYLAGSANLSQLLPGWAQEGGAGAVAERAADPVARACIRDEWTTTRLLGWDEVFVSLIDGDLREVAMGRSVEDTARQLGLHPDEAALELIASSGDRVQMVAFGRHPEDLVAVLRHPAAVVGSDGLALDPNGPTGVGRPHPRSYGCYPRLLGRIVREERTLSLERAVAMSSSLPARRIGLAGRGLVRVDAFADVVVFDAERILDRATFEDPAAFPEGIVHVIVNGRSVIRDGAEVRGAREERPGRVLAGGHA